MPNGFLGYSTSGRKEGSNRKESATSEIRQRRFGIWDWWHTGRLVEVALEDVLVEDEQSLEDLECVLVGSLLSDLKVQVFVRQRLLRLQSLERECGSELRSLIRGRIWISVRSSIMNAMHVQWVMAKLM
jgi:hypothetical protein